MIPTVIEAAYPDWVRTQFAALSVEAEVEDTYMVVPKCPAGSRCCLLLTDDLAIPALRRRLFRLVNAVTPGRVGVLVWDSAARIQTLLGIPGLIVQFPNDDRLGAIRLLNELSLPSSVPELVLDRSLPPSLALAVRRVLRQSGDLVRGPPPRSVADVAMQVGCASGTLYRTASRAGIDLHTLNRRCRVRWIRLAAGRSLKPDEVSRRLGYAQKRGMYRLIRDTLGVSYAQLSRMPLERIDSAVLAVLAGTPERL